MTVGLQISIKPEDLKGIVDSKKAEIQRKISPAIDQTASRARQLLTDRTDDSTGLNGPFAPYSKGYVRFRKNVLRKSSPSIVNLNATGKMMGSMAVESSKGGRIAYLYLAGKSNARKGFLTDRQRPWWGFNGDEELLLSRFFRKRLLR